MSTPVYIGEQPYRELDLETKGEFCQINDETFYKLSNVDQMRPFFMSIVSSEDHWLFISSNKGITAGRKNSDKSLFPYYTDDKVTESAENTGSKTIILVRHGDRHQLWEPFSDRHKGIYQLQRNLYKNRPGSQVIFEEVNADLNLSFQERWAFSNQFGIVKTSEIHNLSDNELNIQVVDGMQNIIPAAISEQLQAFRSNLADAYKKAELLDKGIGIYSLSARIVDRAIPSEALEATVVWSTGLEAEKILLSAQQLAKFRTGGTLQTEQDIRAEKGAYFVGASITLEARTSKKWHIIAEVGQSISDIVALRKIINSAPGLFDKVERDIELNTKQLLEKIARADGLQLSNDPLVTTRHLNNVMFNIMRGGLFMDNYRVDRKDFIKYIKQANRGVAKDNANVLAGLPDHLDISELRQFAINTGNIDLQRLASEYLPLSFSRRHGDPSRPWNKFNIITKDDDGNDLKYYEGNWRDIFQNWEALAISYPEYIENMILKFLNASTIDGYNPYRISSNGVDWEVSDPNDPWSFIGYWGDHQLIYLLKLLEIYEQVNPGKLHSLLGHNYGVYANVPYRLKPFTKILANPQDTIDFDMELEHEIERRVAKTGSDGKLVLAQDGNLLRSTVIEKILISVLTKIANFIPDGGIWMNTQRPEWNDANNALVGNGVSMVTLYQLRRYLKFMHELINAGQNSTFKVNEVILGYLTSINEILVTYQELAQRQATAQERRQVMEALGLAGEQYRNKAYAAFKDSQVVEMAVSQLLEFIKLTVAMLDQTIKSNKREDGLYHSYNILSFDQQSAEVSRLDLMLEGQVNVIASGYLTPGQTLELLQALEKSELYRADQNSYILYPNKQRALFVKRNNIPEELLSKSELFTRLQEDSNSEIVQVDKDGVAHFNPQLHNAEALGEALVQLAQEEAYADLVAQERQTVLTIYEKIFNHKEFTGRSGTFYGYEGLGSIYWHMVSKLVESVSEVVEQAIEQGDRDQISKLNEYYHRLKDGIGVHKAPENYGAIPTDPYSHTPGNKGVQQPGMTGQVKEDILSRFRELGVAYEEGRIRFNQGFFDDKEYLTTPEEIAYLNVEGNWEIQKVNQHGLFFTLCQVPVVYEKGTDAFLEIEYANNELVKIEGNRLTEEVTDEVFSRTGKVRRVRYFIPA